MKESKDETQAGLSAGLGVCPRCQRPHEYGEGTTIDTHFLPYPDDHGGTGYRDFLCTGCGLLLREDIST
jgi:hypothetical protein